MIEENIYILNDLIQSNNPINDIPEIRVWCHPHFIKETGDDYFEVFDTFKEAVAFIKDNPITEKNPVIAFRGKEINIFKMKKK